MTVVARGAYPRGTMQALLDGEIEICLGGLMRSFELADRTGRWSRTSRRCAAAAASSSSGAPADAALQLPGPHRQHRDRRSRRRRRPGSACSPSCAAHGVDPARVRIERERPLAEALAAFRAGEGDFLETTQPAVEDAGGGGRRARGGVHGRGHGPGAVHLLHGHAGFPRARAGAGPALRAGRVSHPALAGRSGRRGDRADGGGGVSRDRRRASAKRAIARFSGSDTWSRDPLAAARPATTPSRTFSSPAGSSGVRSGTPTS